MAYLYLTDSNLLISIKPVDLALLIPCESMRRDAACHHHNDHHHFITTDVTNDDDKMKRQKIKAAQKQLFSLYHATTMSLLVSAFQRGVRRLPRCVSVIRQTCPESAHQPLPGGITVERRGNPIFRRHLSSMNPNDFIAVSLIDSVTFEAVCSDTLESLCDYFEQLVEEATFLKSADITYGDGVLTVNFGEPYGTYVINRQSPNRQIWLSSPNSGPKRYDFIPDKSKVNEGFWLYKHDGVSLHELLQKEIGGIVQKKVDFLSLPHSKRVDN